MVFLIALIENWLLKYIYNFNTFCYHHRQLEIFQQNNPGGGMGRDKLKNKQTNKKLFLGKFSYILENPTHLYTNSFSLILPK